jgi:hypothetical protein
MRLSKSLNSFKFLLVFMMAFTYIASSANTGTTKPKEVKQEQKVEAATSKKVTTDDQQDLSTEEEVQQDHEPAISNSSFNYFFYLIYKVKFEDVFKLPGRSTMNNGVAIHRVNLNAIVERLVQPKF